MPSFKSGRDRRIKLRRLSYEFIYLDSQFLNDLSSLVNGKCANTLMVYIFYINLN
jgi:hypothetical protein